jgi:hypothetical protein
MTITTTAYTSAEDTSPTIRTIDMTPDPSHYLDGAALVAAVLHGLVAALGGSVTLDHHPDATTATVTIALPEGKRAEIGPVHWPTNIARHVGFTDIA